MYELGFVVNFVLVLVLIIIFSINLVVFRAMTWCLAWIRLNFE
jgi:hypothetical protein